MQAMKTAVITAIIVTAMACAIESQAPGTTRQIPKPKVEQRPCKGMKCSTSAYAPPGDRRVGVDEAVPNSWSWQAFVLCTDSQNNRSRCGGSLISDRWILTAAHCLMSDKMDIRRHCKVYVGKHEFYIQESTQLLLEIGEVYDNDYMKSGFDLELIKLARPVKFTNAIKPISLPFGLPELPVNKTCIATGFGDTKYGNNKPSDKLMQQSMTVMDDESCRNTGRPVICTTSRSRTKDLCHGDTGGPLVCQEADQNWYLRGVASEVKRDCGQKAYFTKVAAFEEWIMSTIWPGK